MRKTSFFINLTICSASVCTLTPALSACKQHEHKWDGFVVHNNQLYKTCSDCHAEELVTNEELQEHSNQFLYFDDDGAHFESSSLSSFLTNYDGESVDLYLFGGTYELSVSRATLLKANIYGLLNNEKEWVSHIDCFANGSGDEHFYGCINLDITFDHLYMDGADYTKADEHSFYCGLQANALKYNYCFFTGTQSTYTEGILFENCFFDATMNIVSENKTQYSLFIRNTKTATFKQCNFKDIGKAIKIYTDGVQIKGGGLYNFEDCSFKCCQNIGNTKACIAVDSTYQTDTAFTLYVINCSNDGHVTEYPEQKDEWGDLVQDDYEGTPRQTVVHFEK